MTEHTNKGELRQQINDLLWDNDDELVNALMALFDQQISTLEERYQFEKNYHDAVKGIDDYQKFSKGEPGSPERMAAWINQLSPWNLERGVEALREQLSKERDAGLEKLLRETRVDELKLIEINSTESYLGKDWWADENIKDHSAREVPLSYIENRLTQLSSKEDGDKNE